MDRVPNDICMRIWEFDPTYHFIFRMDILPEIRSLRCRKLARDYFDGDSQCFPEYFRFYQNTLWFTVTFEETEWNVFHVTLWNEKHGTYARHRHIIL
jgi:hypothetical protein